MSRGNIVVTKLPAALLERTELYVAIAVYARVWRLARKVRVAEPVDNFHIERSGEVVNIMGNTKL
jgi:hypothetical protein